VVLAGGDTDGFAPRHRAASMSELSTDRVLDAISEVLRTPEA
jgi:hypothetical protein